MRNCYKCHQNKELDQFPIHKGKGKGHSYICLECQRIANKEYYDQNRLRLLVQKQDYQQSIKGTETNKKRNRKHWQAIKSNPEEYAKAQARWKANGAIRWSGVEKEVCVICHQIPAFKHHPDYNQPLKVVWLCKDHHKEVHYA